MNDVFGVPVPELLQFPLMAGAAAVGVMILIAFARQFLRICRPHEILIFSGRKHRRADGTEVGYRVVFGGRAWRVPVIEQVERMDMRALPIDVSVQGAYTRVGIPLKVRAIAVVKISSSPGVVMNAIERFLGRGVEEIQKVAKDTLEGNLRGVLATLTPEEVNADRLKFAESLSAEVEHDLAKLGLHLDILKIQHVTDDANYLASIGRGQIAQVIRDAEIAESNAHNEAAKEVANAEMRANVADSQAERNIAQKRNDVRRLAAELEAEAKAAEERAEAGALAAQATAMQALEAVRREVESVRLQSDVVIPAEIQREAAALAAAGDAASIAENGRATAASLTLVAEAWAKAGPTAEDMFLLNKIEDITRVVVQAVQRIQIGEVEIVDADGQALPRLAAAYPAAVASVLQSLFATNGVDVAAILTRQKTNGAAEVRP
jgi:flotillin